MKSSLLAGKLQETPGGLGEEDLERALVKVQGAYPELASAVRVLLKVSDGLVSQLATVHQIQLELSGDAFSDWNLRTGRIDSGRQWKTLLGFGEAEFGDAIVDWRRCVHSEDFPRFNEAIAAHVRDRSRAFEVECRMKSRTGAWKRILLRGVVVARDAAGEPMRLLLLQRDVTAFRQSEAAALEARDAAEAASRARGFFLANMSHEIRTPMNGIIGMTDLALDTRLDAEQRHYLRTVKSSAESLLGIVNDILDFSKIESGKLRFEAIPFSLSGLVYDAVRTQSVDAHRKGLEVVVSLARDVPARVVGDPTRLRQVIGNLVGNAVKFTEQGEIEVGVAVETQQANVVTLRFVVRDTGVGIPVARQQAVFEAFSQADDSTTRRYGGTGLGLTICTHLVQMMGGRIWVESVEGQGSRFFFTASLRLAEHGGDELLPTRFPDARALLLSANGLLADQVVGVLAGAGVDVKRFGDARTGVAAIEKMRSLGFPFDFVLVDAMMAAPGGIALAEAWRGGRREEKLIMMLNTEQQRTELGRLRELGIDAYLVKPISPEDIIEALKLVVGKQNGTESEGFLAPFDIQDPTPADAVGQSVSVLLVEDNPVNQELAERLLRKRGFKVTRANNGAEAVDCFEQAAFDIILMDMQMPVMDGIEATETIRSREMRRSWVVSDSFRQVYIIAMTANAMEGDRDRCLHAGMDDYVAKPIKPEDLYAAIERGLGDREMRDVSTGVNPDTAESVASFDLAAAMRDLGDRDLLHTMARMLLSEWDGHLAQIETSLNGRDAGQLRMAAHTVKSLVAIFHADLTRRLALELEQAAHAQSVDWVRCEELKRLLVEEMARLKPAMEAFVRGDVVFPA